MEGAPLALILDVVIMVLLGLTIVYAARLSLQLRRLRDSKSELDRVVRDLIKNLDRAERAIAGMKITAQESGSELQAGIDRALALSDELQLITDSGDRLASRLEGLVDHARPMAATGSGAASGVASSGASSGRGGAASSSPSGPAGRASGQAQQVQTGDAAPYASHLRKLDMAEDRGANGAGAGLQASGAQAGHGAGNGKSAFFIRDPEVERGIDPMGDKMALEDDGSGQGLYSEAERDLFRAMKSRGRPA